MSDATQTRALAVVADDGHRFELIARIPAAPTRSLLWLPALGTAARHYIPFADALAAHGIAVFLHEWRGSGSSQLRADRGHDWGYRELLEFDIPASVRCVGDALSGMRGLDGPPGIIGGHSLGGQLACCHLARHPMRSSDRARALWLVASGAPYWRAFPPPHRYWLPLAYRFLPWLAQRRGALPGRSIGFGGTEARSLIRDWARSALSGRYAADGLDADLEAGLQAVDADVRAIVLGADWLAPMTSLQFLLSKLALTAPRIAMLGHTELGDTPDHYAWMKAPDAVANMLCAD